MSISQSVLNSLTGGITYLIPLRSCSRPWIIEMGCITTETIIESGLRIPYSLHCIVHGRYISSRTICIELHIQNVCPRNCWHKKDAVYSCLSYTVEYLSLVTEEHYLSILDISAIHTFSGYLKYDRTFLDDTQIVSLGYLYV